MKKVLTGLLGAAVIGSVLTAQAQNKFPLRVDIDVSAKQSRKNIGAGAEGEAKIEQVQVRVKIRKSSGEPWVKPVTAELYVIGRQIHTGYYGVLDVIKEEFTFSKENDNTFQFNSKMYSLTRTSGNINAGGTYETYLLVIVDDEGKVVETRSGRVIKEQGIAFIRELGPKTLFDRDGNVIGEFERNKEAMSNAIRSATDPGDDY